jgi:ubiquinone/menaquinone biosynthesis C-methylase UbiE
MTAQSKSFQDVEKDYRFFEQCVDEIDRTLEIWQPILSGISSTGQKVRILDFGCGTGTFTLRALREWAIAPDQVSLFLLDPAESHVQQALGALKREGYSDSTVISAVSNLPDDSIDIIWSHHVFYYVPDIEGVLRDLKRCLSRDGMMLCAISGEKSGAGNLQEEALATGGLDSPYRTGVEVCQHFQRQFPYCDAQPYHIRIQMKDLLENRESIMRFLVGEFRDLVDWEGCLALFDPFSDGETIHVPSEELSIVVRKTDPRCDVL